MLLPGPPLDILLRRLTDLPPDFLDDPRTDRGGQVHVAAVVNDLLALGPGRVSAQELRRFEGTAADAPRLRMTLVLAWLLADERLIGSRLQREPLLRLLDDTARELSGLAPVATYLKDPDRREELVRVMLARLDLRPDGETAAQAADRLSALSATERRRLLEASRAAEARAREIREALVKKAAEASADKWTRE